MSVYITALNKLNEAVLAHEPASPARSRAILTIMCRALDYMVTDETLYRDVEMLQGSGGPEAHEEALAYFDDAEALLREFRMFERELLQDAGLHRVLVAWGLSRYDDLLGQAERIARGEEPVGLGQFKESVARSAKQICDWQEDLDQMPTRKPFLAAKRKLFGRIAIAVNAGGHVLAPGLGPWIDMDPGTIRYLCSLSSAWGIAIVTQPDE